MTRSARYAVDPAFVMGEIHPHLYGSFVEHVGRCVYTGIFEPDHPTADEHGFRGRRDRAGAGAWHHDHPLSRRQLRVGLRLGGRCRSGRGPARPPGSGLGDARDEPGRHERVHGLDPRGGRRADVRGQPGDTRRRCRATLRGNTATTPAGRALSDLRHAHGYPKPHDIRFWCIGNEMDGPWQIGGMDARAYGRVARETAKAMRWADGAFDNTDGRHWTDGSHPGGLTLAACGSSHRDMETYARWEYEVLDECFELVDFISLHTYFREPTDVDDFLANIDRLDAYMSEVAAIADAVAATRRSDKRIMLSLDEWNVWYKCGHPLDMLDGTFPDHPPLVEEIYDVKDALLIGGALITLLNHADRVKAASLAQLVNVIAPIMTEPGGRAWRQTIFPPLRDHSTPRARRGAQDRQARWGPPRPCRDARRRRNQRLRAEPGPERAHRPGPSAPQCRAAPSRRSAGASSRRPRRRQRPRRATSVARTARRRHGRGWKALRNASPGLLGLRSG